MIRREHSAPALSSASHRGQTVILVAIMFVVLLGFAGLAVDVSSAYSTRRFERSVADAAALAGAQDLRSSDRNVTGTMRTAARGHALELLVDQLGASGSTACNASADVIDCQLDASQYHVWIRTPAQYGTSVDPDHAVQVSIYNPTFSTMFVRLFGQPTWDVGLTSVAGFRYASKYAVVTLQPPKPRPNGSDLNLNKDMIVDGNNTVLNVLQGDVGTNTSATTTRAGLIQLADGFYIDHYDDLSIVGETWSQPDGVHPVGRKINSLIKDPSYPIASFDSATTYATQAAGETPCSGADWPTDWATMLTGTSQKCYLPGIYSHEFDVKTGAGPDIAYLMPGAYYFPAGMKMHGTLGGGLIDNAPGVVMVFPQDQILDTNNAENFVVNAGGEGCNADGCRAAPAVDASGNVIETSSGLTITIEVARDDSCFSGVTPIINVACSVNQNHTVNLAGTGRLLVGGILYGPSDNMSINGGSSQTGLVGQIISWSVTYTGGSTLNQSYPGGVDEGVLRLDEACSGANDSCTP